MKLSVTFIFLLLLTISSFSQRSGCKIEILQLSTDENQKPEQGSITDSLLSLARPTNSILVQDAEIKSVSVRIDTVCCTYAGALFLTSHYYELAGKTASRLASLDIPLCCGIPVAIMINGKEQYRAMLWNPLSSFGNKSVTATLVQNTLIVSNQLPRVADQICPILSNQHRLIECAPNN